MPSLRPELRAVARARQRRDRSAEEFRASIAAARAAGATLQEIADVLGVTRQRVDQILKGG